MSKSNILIELKASMPALVLILRSYDYNMYNERLLPANLCLPSSHFINLGTMVSI